MSGDLSRHPGMEERENVPPSTPRATELYWDSTPPGLHCEACESPSPPGRNPIRLDTLLLQTPPGKPSADLYSVQDGHLDSSPWPFPSPTSFPQTPVRPAPGLGHVSNMQTPAKLPMSRAPTQTCQKEQKEFECQREGEPKGKRNESHEGKMGLERMELFRHIQQEKDETGNDNKSSTGEDAIASAAGEGASYESNFRNDGYYDQRWADKWDKWGKRSNWDERYPERQLASCDGSAAMVRGKGAKGAKGAKGGKGGHGKGYFGKGKGEKGKGKAGKGARLPLTDLVPEPDPEQRLLMMTNGIAYYQNILQKLQVDAMKTYHEMNEKQPLGTTGQSDVSMMTASQTMQMAQEAPNLKDNKFTETEAGNWILQFTVRKATPATELGMQVSHHHGQPPLKVQKVYMDGVIPSWNKLCLGDYENRAVRQGDQILAVNEVTDVRGILEEMKNQNMLRFKILRPRSDWKLRTDARPI